jgi:hypothetical protein
MALARCLPNVATLQSPLTWVITGVMIGPDV